MIEGEAQYGHVVERTAESMTRTAPHDWQAISWAVVDIVGTVGINQHTVRSASYLSRNLQNAVHWQNDNLTIADPSRAGDRDNLI